MSQHTKIVGICKVPMETFDYESDKRAVPEIDTNQKFADLKFVYGWDQPLLSFYLQIHDAFAEEYDANPVIWLGATSETKIPTVTDLSLVAISFGLTIPDEVAIQLAQEKEAGV